MGKTNIRWTDETWNPVTGCTKVSDGCDNCYAEGMAETRLMKNERTKKYANGFDLCIHPEELDRPLHWRKPRYVFIPSMGDLFHRDVPDQFIEQVFEVMNRCPSQTFQVLTKRPERMEKLSDRLTWSENIWAGASVENSKVVNRIQYLVACGAHTKFLSCEPLLGPLNDLPLDGVDWVICGGESGAGAREMDPEWARSLRDQCVKAKVAFFFKQWGGRGRAKGGHELDGRVWDQMPRGLKPPVKKKKRSSK
jgi:protein gp37